MRTFLWTFFIAVVSLNFNSTSLAVLSQVLCCRQRQIEIYAQNVACWYLLNGGFHSCLRQWLWQLCDNIRNLWGKSKTKYKTEFMPTLPIYILRKLTKKGGGTGGPCMWAKSHKVTWLKPQTKMTKIPKGAIFFPKLFWTPCSLIFPLLPEKVWFPWTDSFKEPTTVWMSDCGQPTGPGLSSSCIWKLKSQSYHKGSCAHVGGQPFNHSISLSRLGNNITISWQ